MGRWFVVAALAAAIVLTTLAAGLVRQGRHRRRSRTSPGRRLFRPSGRRGLPGRRVRGAGGPQGPAGPPGMQGPQFAQAGRPRRSGPVRCGSLDVPPQRRDGNPQRRGMI